MELKVNKLRPRKISESQELRLDAERLVLASSRLTSVKTQLPYGYYTSEAHNLLVFAVVRLGHYSASSVLGSSSLAFLRAARLLDVLAHSVCKAVRPVSVRN